MDIMDIPSPDGEPFRLGVIQGDRPSNPDHIAAADHILNRSALRSLHETFDTPQLVVAIPCRQLMFVGDVSLAVRGPFTRLAQKLPEGAERLTTVVFLVQDTEIVGKLNYR